MTTKRTWTKEELRTLIDSLALPLTVHHQGRILFVNDAHVKMIGFSREELEGQPADAFLPPEEKQRIRELMVLREKAKRAGHAIPLTSSYPIVSLDRHGKRTRVHVHSSELEGEDGEPFVLSVGHILPDDAAQLRASESLAEIATDLFGRRSEWDVRQAAISALGRAGAVASFVRFEGSKLAPLHPDVSPHTQPLDVDSARAALSEGKPVFLGGSPSAQLQSKGVWLPLTRDGAPAELLVVEGEAFAAIHVPTLSLFARQVASALDAAQLVRSLEGKNRELKETRQEMVKRERLAALGELSAIVAHEVRNPLGVIFNAVSSLRKAAADEADRRLLLDILAEESDRLNRMVGDLLDFARPAALSLSPESLGPVIYEAIATAGAQGDGQAVVFDPQIEDELPPVPLDRRLIHQALVNVLVNAVQAMPKGGRISVRATREGSGELVRIEIRDEGTGIPSDSLPRIFEPFFTTKAKGTGLGLAVVRRIIDEHKGDVWVKSSQAGTAFTLTLPTEARGDTP